MDARRKLRGTLPAVSVFPGPAPTREEHRQLPVPASELFERCSQRDGPGPPAGRIRVSGAAARVFLGHDKVARVVLAADARGFCAVECRCLSDEVLLRVREGAAAVLEGVCCGLEDSLTLVLERCDLLPPVQAAPAVRSGQARVPAPEAARRCGVCGRTEEEAGRLIEGPGISICEACAEGVVAALQRARRG